MALPVSRDYTAADGTQVPSATVNTLQDMAIAHHLGVLIADPWSQGVLDQLFRPQNLTSNPEVRPVGRAGAAYSIVGLRIRCREGVLVSRVGGTALRPYTAYRMVADEIDKTLAAVPGAGLFRRDIISVKLTVTAGVVVLTQTLTQGGNQASEALADANEPATPAGETKILSFVVGNAVSSIDRLKVKDYRMPLGYRTLELRGKDLIGAELAAWTKTTGESIVSSNGAVSLAAFMACDGGLEGNARILEVGLFSDETGTTASTADLVRKGFSAGGITPVLNVNGIIGSTGHQYRRVDVSATPLWSSGYGNSQDGLALADPPTAIDRMLLRILTAAATPKTLVVDGMRIKIAGTFYAEG